MYESPIRLLMQQVETSLREQQDKQIFEAIQKCGVDVDRDELIKALAYDRYQYDKGYADGRADAQCWISVEERLPEAHKNVLVYMTNPIGWWNVEIDWMDEQGWVCSADSEWHTITHWMPLPEPPKEDA